MLINICYSVFQALAIRSIRLGNCALSMTKGSKDSNIITKSGKEMVGERFEPPTSRPEPARYQTRTPQLNS